MVKLEMKFHKMIENESTYNLLTMRYHDRDIEELIEIAKDEMSKMDHAMRASLKPVDRSYARGS
jgi:hypothetical protein